MPISSRSKLRISGLLALLATKKNRDLIAWWGRGIVIAIAGLWAVFVYLYPPKGDGAEGKLGVSASHGSVSIGGSVTNSTIKTQSMTGDEPQQHGH